MRYKKTVYCGRVAQLDRVPGYEPGGRRFDSCRVRHIENTSLMTGFFSPEFFANHLSAITPPLKKSFEVSLPLLDL
jgi:hypothetical protein